MELKKNANKSVKTKGWACANEGLSLQKVLNWGKNSYFLVLLCSEKEFGITVFNHVVVWDTVLILRELTKFENQI